MEVVSKPRKSLSHCFLWQDDQSKWQRPPLQGMGLEEQAETQSPALAEVQQGEPRDHSSKEQGNSISKCGLPWDAEVKAFG